MLKRCLFVRRTTRRKLFRLISLMLLYGSFLICFKMLSNPLISVGIPSRNVLVSIISDWKQLNTLVYASKHTWIKGLSYDILYFVGRSKMINTRTIDDPNVIVLPCDDDIYPPVDKTYAMWNYLFVNHGNNYDYFVTIDSDTYVNVRHLDKLISSLTCEYCYVGHSSPGGNARWRNMTGVVAPYCQGMGYIISQKTLLQFGPHLNDCRRSFSGRHSDTEVARCIYKYVNKLSCSNGQIPFKMVLFTSNEKGQKVNYHLNTRKQMDISFPSYPPTEFFQSVMIHPLKKEEYFYRFHQQVVQNLRPIFPPIFGRKGCVANPTLQQEIYPQNQSIPECPIFESNKSPDLNSLDGFLLNLFNDEQRISQLIEIFAKHRLRVQRLNTTKPSVRPSSIKLTDDQWRLRLTMIDFFHFVIDAQLDRVIVFEDNVLPHQHFGSRLQELLSDKRCANHLFETQGGGGIVMLGTTIWNEGWRILDKVKIKEIGLCRNICSKTFGSFAVIYHRATFGTILNWLNNTIDVPYDHVFAYLSRQGYSVRFALSNLVIKNVTFTTSINQNKDYFNMNKRANIHRWNLMEYLSN